MVWKIRNRNWGSRSYWGAAMGVRELWGLGWV